MLDVCLSNKKYLSFIHYAISTCDSLSLVFEKSDDEGLDYIFQEMYYEVMNFIIERKPIGYHPDTGTFFSNCDYIKMQCCKETKALLLRMGDIQNCNGDMDPEELCFYRKGRIWFRCISHEGMTQLYCETKEDIAFLEKENIQYSYSF